jgi:hypothetical protein
MVTEMDITANTTLVGTQIAHHVFTEELFAEYPLLPVQQHLQKTVLLVSMVLELNLVERTVRKHIVLLT